MNINDRKKSIVTSDIQCCVVAITSAKINDESLIKTNGESALPVVEDQRPSGLGSPIWSKTPNYKIAEHIPISVCYKISGICKHYFGIDCIKRFATDLLIIEKEHDFKNKKQMTITEGDKL